MNLFYALINVFAYPFYCKSSKIMMRIDKNPLPAFFEPLFHVPTVEYSQKLFRNEELNPPIKKSFAKLQISDFQQLQSVFRFTTEELSSNSRSASRLTRPSVSFLLFESEVAIIVTSSPRITFLETSCPYHQLRRKNP